MTRQIKATKTVAKHIHLLRSRGMEVNATLAEQWLSNVSYYRMSAYWYPARALDSTDRPTDRFNQGTTFENATLLYEADRKLRTLVHDGMERIEIALRTRLGEQLCKQDPLAYTNPSNFRETFNHPKWLSTAYGRIARAFPHNEAIKHYRSEYGQFPFWVLAEVLDFGDASRLYAGLRDEDQREIADGLGFSINYGALTRIQRAKAREQHPLVRWMHQLTIIRNTCAHHGRLWNKSFTPAATPALRAIPGLELLPEGQSERIFGALSVMAYLLRVVSPGTTWPDKVTQLIETTFLTNPLVDQRGLGIPSTRSHHL